MLSWTGMRLAGIVDEIKLKEQGREGCLTASAPQQEEAGKRRPSWCEFTTQPLRGESTGQATLTKLAEVQTVYSFLQHILILALGLSRCLPSRLVLPPRAACLPFRGMAERAVGLLSRHLTALNELFSTVSRARVESSTEQEPVFWFSRAFSSSLSCKRLSAPANS